MASNSSEFYLSVSRLTVFNHSALSMALVAVKTLARNPAGSEVLIKPEVRNDLFVSLVHHLHDNPSRIYKSSTSSQEIPAQE